MKIISFVLVVICFVMALVWSLRSDFENPYPVVCELVSSRIYLPAEEMKTWKQNCLHRSTLVKPWSSRKLIIKDISNLFQTLKVSHLEIFDPKQVATMWKGQSLETGIESEFVDSELVIFKVHSKSAAEKAGLRYGDVIVSLNGEQPNPWQLQSTAGKLVYRRGRVETEIVLHPEELQRSENVTVDKISAREWIIKVPSFRKDFFLENPLSEKKEELKNAEKIIVDLRGNQGGNFVAGLHFLSAFVCQPQEIGKLVKPSEAGTKQAEIPDDLDDLKQLEVLDQVHTLILKTPPAEFCLKAKIKVLVDSKTASVAEMVAQTLKEVLAAEIIGAPSSGQLLVGVWYPLDELGKGVQISIPEALYESRDGRQIEGHGVEVNRILYYNLDEMQKGEDSWVKKAFPSPRATKN